MVRKVAVPVPRLTVLRIFLNLPAFSSMKEIQQVSVFGLGKLGACIAATLAQRGFQVLGVDIDPEKVRRINAGEAPVEEPLLAETIRAAGGRLRATTDIAAAVATDASCFIPPSPSLPDGSFDNSYLLNAMRPLAVALRQAGKRGHLFVINSTTTPGAVDDVFGPMLEQELAGRAGVDFGLCYNPEFIALGNVIKGLLEPDLVLIGESDPASGDRLEALYRRYTLNQPRIARMSPISAELTKISVNSFITMKISFTNQLRMIAARFANADIHAVLDAIGTDSRINKKYLKAGLSYGGPCFPRDNRLLSYTARRLGLSAPMAEASDRVNEMAKEDLLREVANRLGPGDAVAVLGLSYKPDTYILEESAGLHLAANLLRQGVRVFAHDYLADVDRCPELKGVSRLVSVDALAQIPSLKVVVIACPWPGYRGLTVPPTATLVSHWQT